MSPGLILAISVALAVAAFLTRKKPVGVESISTYGLVMAELEACFGSGVIRLAEEVAGGVVDGMTDGEGLTSGVGVTIT